MQRLIAAREFEGTNVGTPIRQVIAGNDADVITNFTSGTDKINLDAVTTGTAVTAVTGSLTIAVNVVYFLAGGAAGEGRE